MRRSMAGCGSLKAAFHTNNQNPRPPMKSAILTRLNQRIRLSPSGIGACTGEDSAPPETELPIVNSKLPTAAWPSVAETLCHITTYSPSARLPGFMNICAESCGSTWLCGVDTVCPLVSSSSKWLNGGSSGSVNHRRISRGGLSRIAFAAGLE